MYGEVETTTEKVKFLLWLASQDELHGYINRCVNKIETENVQGGNLIFKFLTGKRKEGISESRHSGHGTRFVEEG